MPLKIPKRTLDDNYKLSDFQDDYNKLYELYSKPVKVQFSTDKSTMRVTNQAGRTLIYKLKYSNGKIYEVVNTTEGITVPIERGGQ